MGESPSWVTEVMAPWACGIDFSSALFETGSVFVSGTGSTPTLSGVEAISLPLIDLALVLNRVGMVRQSCYRKIKRALTVPRAQSTDINMK